MKQRPARTASRAPEPAGAELLTTSEVAGLLRVHPKQVYRLFPRGLPRHRVGGEWRFRRDEVLRWAAGAPDPGSSGVAAPPPLLASNGDVVVEVLLATAREEADAWVGDVRADRETALGLLRAGRALAVGYHGSAFPRAIPEGRLARLHLVRREVGLVAPRGRAPRVEDCATARLASRPATAGLRRTLDRALAGAGLDPVAVHAAARICDSHLGVVHAVARGEADLGIATHAWARRLGLAFARLEDEDYGLLFLADRLGRLEATRLCEAAQGATLRGRLGGEAGYDTAETGALRFDREPSAGAAP